MPRAGRDVTAAEGSRLAALPLPQARGMTDFMTFIGVTESSEMNAKITMVTKKQQRELDRREREAVRKGLLYRVHWNVGGYAFGPHYESTLENALNKVDEMIKERRNEMPNDIHARRGEPAYMVVHIEE